MQKFLHLIIFPEQFQMNYGAIFPVNTEKSATPDKHHNLLNLPGSDGSFSSTWVCPLRLLDDSGFACLTPEMPLTWQMVLAFALPAVNTRQRASLVLLFILLFNYGHPVICADISVLKIKQLKITVYFISRPFLNI